MFYSEKYVTLKVHALDKYSKRIDRQQQRLLFKLKNKEKKFQSRLANSKDSLLAKSLNQSVVSFDSISQLIGSESLAAQRSSISSRSHKVIDTLKAIQCYAQRQLRGISSSLPVANQTEKLQSLQQRLAWQEHMNDLIDQRSKQLQGIAQQKGGKLAQFTPIQKTLYYAKSRMTAYKRMADDPSLAEEKALEYLEGTEGFSQALQNAGGASSGSSMQSAKTVEDLERMGFQTKRQVNAGLKEKFGEGTGAMQQSMAGQVSDWQESLQKPLADVKKAQKDISGAKTEIASTASNLKGTRQGARQGARLSFKPNPMRGLPLTKRLEKTYSWNVRRADASTRTPASLEGAAMIGFKHTPKLSYGIGLAVVLGLGKDWNNIHLSMEGIGLRSYAAWQWQWGIGGYAGYERLHKKALFQSGEETISPLYPQKHSTEKYNESVLLGLTKSYRINSKWNGAVQVLYDVWWKDKNLNNPIIIRFITGK